MQMQLLWRNLLESGHLEGEGKGGGGKDNITMDLKRADYEGGRWMEVAKNCVQQWALVLAMLNLEVLVSECLKLVNVLPVWVYLNICIFTLNIYIRPKLLFNAFGPAIHKFPNYIWLSIFGWALSHSCTTYFQDVLISDAISSVPILRVSQIYWLTCSLTSTSYIW